MAALRTTLSALALGLAILAGCTPVTTPTPLPQPSPTCTPEAGGTPYTCTPYQYEEMVAKDRLYTEAETVYRKYLTEEARIYRAGGVTEPTPVLLETTTGKYQSDAMEIFRDLVELKVRVLSGDYTVSWIRRTPGPARSGSVVALTSCVDGSKVRFSDGKGGSETGTPIQETGYFVVVEGSLKLANADSKVVPTC